MTILVRNCRTHLYVKNLSEWVTNPEEAMIFSTSDQAIRFCSEYRIPEVEIVLRFDDKHYDIHIPISEECGKNSAGLEAQNTNYN